MIKLKSPVYLLPLLLGLSACASVQSARQPVATQCPSPAPPPAWMLAPPSNSPQMLDQLITVSPPA